MFLAFMNQIVSIFGGNNYENKKAVINNFIVCNNITTVAIMPFKGYAGVKSEFVASYSGTFA